MAKQNKSWEKRLSGSPDKETVDFIQSLDLDKRLYKYDIAGSIAHAEMLRDQKLITADDFKAIKNGLLQIEAEITEGKFKFDPNLEDIHMAIEDALIKKAGDAGKKLHTARSRNDQVATDLRLWLRDEIEILQEKIFTLQNAFVKSAGEYITAVMPAYTHLQRAQPVTIAAYLLSFVEQLERDYIRLDNCSSLLNISPLGSGAIAGSTLPIDRKATAEKLGFANITANSIDAVSDRDFCAEFIFDCALTSIHLSRLAEDWIIFSSSEFDFLRIEDSYCTSSSMMPQKRNPDLLELIRAKSAGLIGSLVSMLTILKALPTGYNRDLQEDKVHLFASADTLRASLNIACAIVKNTKFNVDKIKTGLDEGFCDATTLAEYLVTRSVPFRQAHQIVGQIVAFCENQNKKLRALTLEEYKKFCPSIEKDVYEYLGAQNVVKKLVTEGSAGFEQSKKMLELWRNRLKEK